MDVALRLLDRVWNLFPNAIVLQGVCLAAAIITRGPLVHCSRWARRGLDVLWPVPLMLYGLEATDYLIEQFYVFGCNHGPPPLQLPILKEVVFCGLYCVTGLYGATAAALFIAAGRDSMRLLRKRFLWTFLMSTGALHGLLYALFRILDARAVG